ncbi:MAG: hypothetical protein LAE24_12495 [Candidatus Contendobacter sp.]|nr:hypothetical protein [Candidatus Contendobacter sp.]
MCIENRLCGNFNRQLLFIGWRLWPREIVVGNSGGLLITDFYLPALSQENLHAEKAAARIIWQRLY